MHIVSPHFSQLKRLFQYTHSLLLGGQRYSAQALSSLWRGRGARWSDLDLARGGIGGQKIEDSLQVDLAHRNAEWGWVGKEGAEHVLEET